MAEKEEQLGHEELQFDRVVSQSAPPGVPGRPAVACVACYELIETEYFHINGKTCCARCRDAVEAAAETPRDAGALITAGLFGVGAAVAGAVLYYAVMAIAHLEIGIVAILIGYMVGYAVRKGVRGRGGLRFQILAVVLTYTSVALAYAPFAVATAMNRSRPTTSESANAVSQPTGGRDTATPVATIVGLVPAFAFILALPLLVVFGNLPSGLISGFIIAIGMRQAWRMTGAPMVEILGPYRVGADPVSAPA